MRKVRAAEGHPGVLETIDGVDFHMFGAHHETGLRGRPGKVIAQRHGAVCMATVDGAVWITHLKRADDGECRVEFHVLCSCRVIWDAQESEMGLVLRRFPSWPPRNGDSRGESGAHEERYDRRRTRRCPGALRRAGKGEPLTNVRRSSAAAAD